MAKQAHHRTPKLRGEGVTAGCLWGLFNSFDVHQRFRLRKMLGERKGTDNRRHATGSKEPKTKMDDPPGSDERDLTEADANISLVRTLEQSPQVEDKVEPTGKPSGKSRRRKSIAQEISKQQDVHVPKQKGHRRSVTPFATRLLRTISIHHMESDDGDHPNEKLDDSQIQDPPLVLSHTSDPSAADEHMPTLAEPADEVDKGKRSCEAGGTTSTDPAGYTSHRKLDDVLGFQLLEKQALLQEKLREAKKSLLEHQKGDGELQESVARRHSSDILEVLELFNANNELFLKLLPGTTMTNSFQDQGDTSCGRALTKCSSFPGAGFSVSSGSSFKLRDEATPSKKQETESEAENLQSSANTDSTKDETTQFTDDAPPPRPAPFAQGILETASSSELPSSFTHVGKRQRDNGSASYRFKVIKQRIKDIIKDNKKERQRIAMDRVLHKIPYGCKASQDTKGDKPLLWEGPDSDRCDGEGSRFSFSGDAGGSTNRISFSSIPRSQSLSESVERYAHLLESTSRRESKPQVSDRLKLVHEDGGSQVTNPPGTFGRIFSLPEFDAYFSKDDQKDDQNEVSQELYQSKPTPVEPAKGSEEAIDVDGADGQDLSWSLDNGSPDTSVSDHGTSVASSVLTVENIATTPLDELVAASCMEASDTPAEPSSVAVVDPYLAEDPVIPAESFVTQGQSEPEAYQTHVEEQDLSDNQESQSDLNDDSNIMETDEESNANGPQIPGMQLDFDTPHVPADNKHEVEFNYVREMLQTYLLDGNEIYERWPSHTQQPNPPVSKEVEGSTHELESNNRFSDFNLDRELLYDLTNQILIDIYESSYGHIPWLSSMGSHIRPVPVGYHLLEEVWANISWHLKSEPHAHPTLEYIIERDFKNDGWMNLTGDVEYVGLDLEALLFDDLLDETIFEVLDWDGLECLVS